MISIIVATYNSCNKLENALNSIINQNYKDWECIIVDGASTDGTIDIIKDYCSKDVRFRYISEKDNGIYDALNKGCKLAKGEWTYVLGSDDELTIDGLANLLKYDDGTNDVIYGNVYLKSRQGIIKKFISKSVDKLSYVMICSHQAVIIKKSVIDKLGGYKIIYPIRADFDLLQRAYLCNYKFKYSNIFVAYFLEDGISSNAKISTHIERYYICKNNKSSKVPMLWYLYQEVRFFAGRIRNKLSI